MGIAWHLVPLWVVMHRAPAWIAWWCLYAVAFRVLVVWLFNNTGSSVFAVALFHATLNLSFMLFPVNGSHFDMRLGGIVMAVAAAMVIARWGPTTLVRTKTAGRRWPVRTALGLGILALAIVVAVAVAVPNIIPVFRFPHPTGPRATGTLTYHWEDASRATSSLPIQTPGVN